MISEIVSGSQAFPFFHVGWGARDHTAFMGTTRVYTASDNDVRGETKFLSLVFFD